MLGADRSGSVHNTLRFTITTATTTESASAPHTFIKTAIIYIHLLPGERHMRIESPLLGLAEGWSALVEHHPASVSSTRSVRSLTAAPRNEHNSSQHTAVLWSGMIHRPSYTPPNGHRYLDKRDGCSRFGLLLFQMGGGAFEPNIGR